MGRGEGAGEAKCMPCLHAARSCLPLLTPLPPHAPQVLDLRFCKFPGANLSGKTLSGALMVDTDLSGANMRVGRGADGCWRVLAGTGQVF